MTYKFLRNAMGTVDAVRHPDGYAVPIDPDNADYQQYQRWVAAGNTADPADPAAPPEPTRDDRLLAAVDAAKTAVSRSKSFTAEQAAVLSAVFDGLGKAITGEAQ